MDGSNPRTPRETPRRRNAVAVIEDEAGIADAVGALVVSKPVVSLLLAGSLGLVVGLFLRRP